MDERKVKRIYHPPAVPAADLFKGGKQRRVAAYARVSTASDEQLNSVEAQKDYFAKLIRQRPDWIFVGVYADEGITGTSINRREAFNRMVADALAGNIDLIVTKSISRFARNTVDTLNTIRQLKAANVEVFFEKENIYTMDSKGEFLITLLSSIAEEESRSISENVKWGQRKRFADGKYSVPYKHFLGYRKGADGIMEIVPEEAKVVRWIYHMFLEGISPTAIATILTTATIPSPAGGDQWWPKTVMSILTNEKYYGAARLQKKFTVDFLQKKMKVNEGEVPQYYVEHSHEAIIAPEKWERAQLELARRKNSTRRSRCDSPFSRKLVCGECGEYYGSKVWHSNSKYRRTVWQCNAKYADNKHCATPHLYEDDLKHYFIQALSELLTDRDALLNDLRTVRAELLDVSTITTEETAILQELEVLKELIKKLINENAVCVLEQAGYAARYNSLVEKFENLQSRYDTLQQQKQRKTMQAEWISGSMFALEEIDLLDIQFSNELWNTVIDRVTVYADERLVFRFKIGADISVQM